MIEAARAYDDSDTIEDIMSLPRMVMTRAGILYDALRACASDGTDPTPRELDSVLRAADAIGISRDVVAELLEIVMAEQALRWRRHHLVVAPSLPKSLNASIAEIAAEPS